MNTKDFRFTIREGCEIVNGKSHYPAMLRLEMERRDMLLVAEELIRMARSTEERWQFVFHGTLSEVPPE